MTAQMSASEISLFRDNVKRFIAENIQPEFMQWEKSEIFPRQLWNKIGEAGLLCVDLPEEFGGCAAPFRCASVVAEELSYAGFAGVATSYAVHAYIVANYVMNSGSQAQKNKYLAKMVSGECVGAIAMTEPGTGSDLQGIVTTAKADGDDYIINGSKTFITNGQHCDVVIVAAKTNEVGGAKGLSLFLVDSDAAGFQRGTNLDKIGLHCADTSELFFDNVRVSKTDMLGPLDKGFLVLMNELQRERLSLAIGSVCATEGVLNETIQYVKERKAFGKPISALQNTRFKIAEMATEVRIHRAFINECMDNFESGKLDIEAVSMAKYSCSEMQGRVVDYCLQLHGGYGYMTEYPVARAFVDARVQRIYGGTSEIMLELISRSVLA